MTGKPKKVHVGPETRLAGLLDEAAKGPLLLERNGQVYRLERWEPAKGWSAYDPVAVIAAIDATAGALTEEEADTLISDLYRARKEGSRPANRW
jgi:hypothetical protein